jgi:hypothetical protein
MPFSEIGLARRLERAEGHACVGFAEARRRASPGSDSEFIEHAGAFAVFDGPNSPVTQIFCVCLFEDLTPAAADVIEVFFLNRGASVDHEVSPFAGVATLDLLCERGYCPIEISSVLYRTIEPTGAEPAATPGIHVRAIGLRAAAVE